MYGWFRSHKEQLIKHAEISIDVFCPEINEHGKVCDTIEASVRHFRMIFDCLRKMYYVDARCWNYEDAFKEFVSLTVYIIEIWSVIIFENILNDKSIGCTAGRIHYEKKYTF